MNEQKTERSIGEQRVGADFNPSGSGNVNFFKNETARIINVCEEMKPKEGEPINGEKLRLIALAQTAYEQAVLWAVKAATA